MAWTFLWPFLDKMLGLNHQTTTAQARINGGNPTKGFLSGSAGLFSGFYTSIAGAGIVNVLFMTGLLGIGVALALGIAMNPPPSPARQCSSSCGAPRCPPQTTYS
jgi:thiosulfate dehydrogenase (quinone) large subunit